MKAGGCLPNDPDLAAELTAHTYVFRGDKLWVEEKEQVRDKLGRSPDGADACALTFAYDVVAQPQVHGMSLAHLVNESYASASTSGDVYNPMGDR